MRNKFLLLIATVLVSVSVFAQDEELSELKFNASLYYSTKPYHPTTNGHKYVIDKKNIIVFTDTLSLPFVDDFSRNNLRSYKWIENNITDTFINVISNCLGPEGIPFVSKDFMQNQSWFYTYDTLLDRVDSVAKDAINFKLIGISTSNCFTEIPQNVSYWPLYYTYKFDSITGKPKDSLLVINGITNVNYAPVIYYAQGEPGKIWLDNYAYVNSTYPINPPTIGVATLDGLNEFGLPYNNASVSTYGTADYLTSKPIDLSVLTHGDSVYLSFFYEGQGLGDAPDKLDSLLVDFKDNSGSWNTVWSDTGYSSSFNVSQNFRQVLINIPSLPVPLNYYHNTFQFRFRNKASLYGNNDHWHIDYVKLDKNRSSIDSILQDIAFVYPITTILKNFTLMPADQFTGNSDLIDTLTLTVHNMDPNANNNPPATNFIRGASELYPTASIVSTDVLQTFNAADYSYIPLYPSTEYTIGSIGVDSLVVTTKISIDPNDIRSLNDTVFHTQKFSNVMAYDDGTAEKTYGLFGLGIKKFAYEFILNQPDTLVAFQFQFSQVDANVSDLIFNFYIWDSIKLNDFVFSDTIGQLYSLDNKKPLYVDSVNGFATYKLDTPIIIPNKLYIGWAQNDDRRLQVGYDLNSTLGKAHMYIYSNSTWKKSTITPAGSPMIRLIFDSDYYGGSTAIKDVTKSKSQLSIYPNPTNGMLFIKGENPNALYEISVVNMMGQVVKHQSNVASEINMQDLVSGVYLLSTRDMQTGKMFYNRVIKSTN